MLVLLSPAKSLDYESPLPVTEFSEPRLLDEASALIELLRGLSVSEIAGLMHISDELAALNAQRYADFSRPFTPANARQALLAFHGDVYLGLDAHHRFGADEYGVAQTTLRILSGLYGVLRPLDLMQPYRLEMGTRLASPRGRTLYAWWGETISGLLREDLAASPGADVVVNLASEEYAKAVSARAVGVPFIAPRFEDTSAQGRRSVVSFYAKRARGEMAGWIVGNRIGAAEDLRDFAEAGYRFDAAASTPERPVFVRTFADRPAPVS
ncbi:MAG: peroxide stress protein YaaA [Propioniciclava sp.]